jgi:hypothetical protein
MKNFSLLVDELTAHIDFSQLSQGLDYCNFRFLSARQTGPAIFVEKVDSKKYKTIKLVNWSTKLGK